MMYSLISNQFYPIRIYWDLLAKVGRFLFFPNLSNQMINE